MLTLFTTAKPFEGHSGIIQRNALASWKQLSPDVEVILFGDEKGTQEVSAEFGLRNEPFVERNEFGTKRLDYMFRKAQEIARHDLIAYCNCDIILPSAFADALRTVSASHKNFLMVGRRWDTDVTEPLNFSSPDWQQSVLQFARSHGIQQPGYSVDYFAFRRGFYSNVPPLVVGRVWWDHWLVWQAGQNGDVVDVSSLVTAVHQNHNYGYHPAGAKGVWTDEQANRNYSLAGGRWHMHTIDDASFILDQNGERKNSGRFLAPYIRYFHPKVAPAWFGFLNFTRPVRNLLGLRKQAIPSTASQDPSSRGPR